MTYAKWILGKEQSFIYRKKKKITVSDYYLIQNDIVIFKINRLIVFKENWDFSLASRLKPLQIILCMFCSKLLPNGSEPVNEIKTLKPVEKIKTPKPVDEIKTTKPVNEI